MSGRARDSPHAAYASSLTLDRPARVDSAFAKLVQRLSEPGGYFDSDNLISNETSYLHVLDGMRRLKVQGGAYIGVGPDQNFSYIAAVRPNIAFMIDIRRDNLLEHLLFKSLFAMSRNRVEYLVPAVRKATSARRGPMELEVDSGARRLHRRHPY